MSNTGPNKKLASFNCDEELWTEFVSRCQQKGTTATTTLIQFIKLYLDGSVDNLDALRGSTEYERVKAYIDEELAAERDKWAQLQSTVIALSLNSVTPCLLDAAPLEIHE